MGDLMCTGMCPRALTSLVQCTYDDNEVPRLDALLQQSGHHSHHLESIRLQEAGQGGEVVGGAGAGRQDQELWQAAHHLMARLDLWQGESPGAGVAVATDDFHLGHHVGGPAEDRLGAAVDPVQVQAVQARRALDGGGVGTTGKSDG